MKQSQHETASRTWGTEGERQGMNSPFHYIPKSSLAQILCSWARSLQSRAVCVASLLCSAMQACICVGDLSSPGIESWGCLSPAPIRFRGKRGEVPAIVPYSRTLQSFDLAATATERHAYQKSLASSIA